MKRSIKARTTGKVKRKVKKSIIPFYGKKGMGWIKNPKKAVYNKIYNKTTFSFRDILKRNKKKTSRVLLTPLNDMNNNEVNKQMKSRKKGVIIAGIIAVLIIIAGISGAIENSKEKTDLETTTIVERVITDSNEEISEDISAESKSTASTTEKTTIATTKATTTEHKTTTQSITESEKQYILNTSSMKFHIPTCRGVKDMKEENKQEYTGTRQGAIDMGYSPCGICHP